MVAWLDQPVLLHSSRADTCFLTAEQCAYRSGHWRYWYQADHVYALGTVYFFVATIAVCAMGFWSMRLAPNWLRRTSWWQKLVGFVRFAAYRRYNNIPSLAVLFLLVAGAIFFLAMTLGPQPYYWPNTKSLSYGSSPPLATRTGWMALACLPFLMILPTQSNMIAALTGTSHDRLIVFHNWIAWAMFVLALIHTFPFIIFHEWKGDMKTKWKTDVTYWTGVVAIVFQFYLTIFSISWIRNRFYEFFKVTHYIAAVLFAVFFFIHCDFRLTSWDYFIAAGVLYSLSFLYSQIRTYFEHGLGHRATFTMVSPQIMKVVIPTARHNVWQPGQHIFARFLTLGLHAFTAHPFTICSVPNGPAAQESSKLVFYIKPRGGVTGRLGKVAAARPGTVVPVLLDGPYGGIKGRALSTYDRGLVVACGSGAGLSLGFVMDWIARTPRVDEVGDDKTATPIRRLQVVIATRDAQLVEWYWHALMDYLEENGLTFPTSGLDIFVFVTGSAGFFKEGAPSLENVEKESQPKTSATPSTPDSEHARIPIKVSSGRPNLTTIVRETTLERDVSIGIVVCGPRDVCSDVQAEAAAAQLRIVGSKPGAKEVFMHAEKFSW